MNTFNYSSVTLNNLEQIYRKNTW